MVLLFSVSSLAAPLGIEHNIIKYQPGTSLRAERIYYPRPTITIDIARGCEGRGYVVNCRASQQGAVPCSASTPFMDINT